MRISDWSSDVCSSDLRFAQRRAFGDAQLEFEGGIADALLALVFGVHPGLRQHLADGRREPVDHGVDPHAAGTVQVTRDHQVGGGANPLRPPRSEEHTSELQSLMRISYAVFCLQKK